jgi:predicted nucleic acid-binding protein
MASYFAIMEALDVEQENKWAKQKVRSNHDFQWIVRRRRQRELKPTSLTQVANQFTQRFFVELKNAISWVPLDERVWEEAVSLAAHTNVTATDCIHLATALAQECDLLVTADDPLINAAKERIAVAKPEQVLKALRGAQDQS